MARWIRNQYDKALTYENLMKAHKLSKRGKFLRKDVILFSMDVEENIQKLYEELKTGKYQHGSYTSFKIYEPKERIIEKAPYRDRIVHRWVVDNFLMPYYGKSFIKTTYACLEGRGLHKAAKDLQQGMISMKKSYREYYVLKMDVSKYFNSIDKKILYKIFVVYIIFGLLIFSVNRGEYAYFDLLHYSTNHPFFIALFLLPVTLFAVIFIEHKYYNNYNNLLRIGNRKKIINSNFKLIFLVVSDLFTILISTGLILTNIFANRNYYIASDKYYGVSNLLLLVISLFKTYIFAIIMGLLGSYLSNKKVHTCIVIILLIMTSFMGVVPNRFLFLFPGYYISNYHIFYSISKNIIFSTIYLIVIFLVCFILYKRKWNGDIL